MSEKDEDKRNAVDILLSIEHQLKSIYKTIVLYDSNMKTILDRVNKIYSKIDDTSIKQKDEIIDSAVNVSSDFIVKVDNTPKPDKRGSRENVLEKNEELENKNINLDKNKIEEENFKEVVFNSKSIPVEQRVVDNNGKDIYMADVEIKTDSGELVKKMKTSPVGVWRLPLKPGKYTVHISKMNTTSMTKVESLQEITVDAAQKSVKLPTIIIKRS